MRIFHPLLTESNWFLQIWAPRGQGCPLLACSPYQSLIEMQLVTPQPRLGNLVSAYSAVDSDDPSTEGRIGMNLKVTDKVWVGWLDVKFLSNWTGDERNHGGTLQIGSSNSIPVVSPYCQQRAEFFLFSVLLLQHFVFTPAFYTVFKVSPCLLKAQI